MAARRARWAWRAAAALVAVLAVLLPAAPAFAHDHLVATTPADRSAPNPPPNQIVLRFDDAVQPVGATVSVLGPDGEQVATSSARVAGDTVTQRVTAPTEAGTFLVSWHIVSADGHPVTGRFSYDITVAASAAATAPPQPAGTATATPGVAAAGGTPTPPTAASGTTGGPANGTTGGAGHVHLSGTAQAAIGVFVAVLVAVVAWGAWVHRSSGRTGPPSGPGGEQAGPQQAGPQQAGPDTPPPAP